ncbi:ethanolamine kinase 2 [Limosa lapponica baueri]|uniref:ethanolamine kinase n=1 Tax=Limosa lapponica baueri TaxID=1758121 RepID=A0A2I0TDK0_LIMLA|nr:ethanolamine kinase 2 [Limosa lapponica baueri]
MGRGSGSAELGMAVPPGRCPDCPGPEPGGGGGTPAVLHLGIAVDEGDVLPGALRLMRELRPGWEPEKVKTKRGTIRLVAQEMARVHAIHANGSLPKPILWQKLHKYLTLVKTDLSPKASHFLWACWGLIQDKYSTIDFNFLRYAKLRFKQYFKMKPVVTALQISK